MPEAGPSRSQEEAQSKGKKRQLSDWEEAEREPSRIARTRVINCPEELLKNAEREEGVILPGEDIDDESRRVHGSATDKPVRCLDNFIIFNGRDGNRIISLDELEKEGSRARLKAVGYARPHFVDPGDEEDCDEEDEAAGALICTTEIFDWWVNHRELNDPIWIETDQSWYILEQPSDDYHDIYNAFATNHKVVQTLLSLSANEAHEQLSHVEEDGLLSMFSDVLDGVLPHLSTDQDITNAMPALMDAVLTEGESLLESVLVRKVIRAYDDKHIFGSSRTSSPRPTPPLQRKGAPRRHKMPAPYDQVRRNLDERALRTQNRIHVTHFIHTLTSPYFPTENFQIVDAPPKTEVDSRQLEDATTARYESERKLLKKCVRYARIDSDTLAVREATDSQGDSPILMLKSEKSYRKYKIGDVVLFLPGTYNGREGRPLPAELPDNGRLEEFFWFGMIIGFDFNAETCHIMWLEHSSRTLLGPIGNKRELFAFPQCSNEPMAIIRGVVDVRILKPEEDFSDDFTEPYFIKLMYEKSSASFVNLPVAFGDRIAQACSFCQIGEQNQDDGKITKSGNGKVAELPLFGEKLHVGDFILFNPFEDDAEASGCAAIGEISSFEAEVEGAIRVIIYGLLQNLRSMLPEHVILHERALFKTEETRDVPLKKIVRKCFVLHPEDFSHRFHLDEGGVLDWLGWSSDHYIVGHQTRNLNPGPSSRVLNLERDAVRQCKKDCAANRFEKRLLFSALRDHPLNVVDYFAGSGALSAGLEHGARLGSAGKIRSLLKTTHLIEIAPSAAMSCKRNFPDAKVLNECANIVLKYTVDSAGKHNGKRRKRKSTVVGVDEYLPEPPGRGEVGVLVGGYPCQFHSLLNRFPGALTPKALQFLNLLSHVDIHRPPYVIAENVAGFLRFNLDSSLVKELQSMDKTGIILFVHCLVQMGYQVRFRLLNAVHYGVPQRRVRFILIAAKRGRRLPEMPTPTHYHPRFESGLVIKFKDAEGQPLIISDENVKSGRAPFPFVSIEDAIDDLPRWDLKARSDTREGNLERTRKLDDPDLLDYRGMRGHEEVPREYTSRESSDVIGPKVAKYIPKNPKNAFQQRVRAEGDKSNMSRWHVVRKESERTIELMECVPLKADADYKALLQIDPQLLPTHLKDPSYANAQKGYRSRAVRRADKDDVYQTTVTNFSPFAKQSQVLHPWCRRPFTPWELARSQSFPDWYEFVVDEGSTNRLKAVHRLIGNAVPWGLAEALGRSLLEAEFQNWVDGGMVG